MPLTAVVGSSGSGKTTFLNDVHKFHKCVYIRQCHCIRPYVRISSIPCFNPGALPYWDTYVREGTASTITAGGSLAGKFTAGLSGGQRKLLLFELVYQRTQDQSDLLICLDEPFSGVTDDFVPFLVERLEHMRQRHNILLVTNDHVKTLTQMADNTITVSALDRTKVEITNRTNDTDKHVKREAMIEALALGDDYVYETGRADLLFFFQVEVLNNRDIECEAMFVTILFSLFIAAFWSSDEENAPSVLIASMVIAFFAVHPYLLGLVDWRHCMTEEAEALLHASPEMNRFLKCLMCTWLVLIVAVLQYASVNYIVEGLSSTKFFVGILFGIVGDTTPYILLSLYTGLSFQAMDIFATIPMVFWVYFSTIFSPGSGLPYLNSLRYLCSPFYFWCMLPGVGDKMEGCPVDETVNLLLLCLTAMTCTLLFGIFKMVQKFLRSSEQAQIDLSKRNRRDDLYKLQLEIFGEEAVKRLKHQQQIQ